jgi:hypothetical protein
LIITSKKFPEKLIILYHIKEKDVEQLKLWIWVHIP